MDFKKWLIILVIIILICFFAGCEESETVTVDGVSDNIKLDSSVVELVKSDLNKITEGEKVLRVEAKFLFRNIADRAININIQAEFFDENNNLLYTGGPNKIESIPAGWSETDYSPMNIITYNGLDAVKVDNARLTVWEY